MPRKAGTAPLVLGACAAGLAIGSTHSLAGGVVALGSVVVFAWVAGAGPLVALAVVALSALSMAFGSARTGSLEAPPLRSTFLPAGSKAVLQESPRAERFGWRVPAIVGGNRLLLRGSGRAPGWTAGTVTLVEGTVRPVESGEGWLLARRITGVARVRPGPVVGSRGGPAGWLDSIRRSAGMALGEGLGAAPSALLRGMVLGDDSAMDRALRDRMRKVGLGHIVAASGANVAILAALVFAACAVLGAGFRTRLVACGLAIALYAPLCGSGPSIVRAAVGGMAILAAAMLSRPASRWQALLLAAVLTLSLDPLAWRDVGWQLSYSAVVGIGVLAGPARSWLSGRGLAPWAAEGAAVTFAATTATAPVSALAFGTISPVALPVNVAAAPLVAPATWLGMVAGTVGQIDARLAWPFTQLARLPLEGILAIAALAARFPFAQVHVSPAIAVLVALACASAVLASKGPGWRWPALCACAAMLAGAAAWATLGPAPGPGAPADGGTRVSFLDVGQGDATLFQSRGRSLLVDAGPPGSGVVGRLREAGVGRLDALLVTHAQADHLGGAAEVLRSMPVGLLVDGRSGVMEPAGREMAQAARERGVPSVKPQAGDRFTVGDLAAEVLWPSGPSVPGADPNLRCVVLRVTGAGATVLLGGDAESEVITPLHPGAVDLLKVSHHGSSDPGLASLLQETRPRIAVIEVGAANSYGHPAPATVATLARAGASVMRTDRDGTVRVDLSRGHLRVHGQP